MDFLTFVKALIETNSFYKEEAVRYSHTNLQGKHYYEDPGGSHAIQTSDTTIEVSHYNPFTDCYSNEIISLEQVTVIQFNKKKVEPTYSPKH